MDYFQPLAGTCFNQLFMINQEYDRGLRSYYTIHAIGAILKVNFSGFGYNWDSLIFDFASANDPNTLICDKYRNAIYNNYSKRLNAKFVTYHLLQDTYDYDYASYVLIFRDGRNETFEINLGISVNNDYIESY